MSNFAVLLINLGSPDSTSVKDVRRYLREFLSDPRVLDAPAPVRALVLNLFILPFRPKKSAEAYSSIWTEQGSPLMVTSFRQQKLVADKVDIPVALAMRYGTPSIPEVIADLVQRGVDELFVMPLYPHYAMSSYETVVVRVMEVVKQLKPEMRVEMLQPFYKDEDYIDALVENTAPHLDQPFDRILFSFHGIPERHLRKSDPSHAHCLCTPDCCNNPNPAHATCYRHQCFETVKALVARFGLQPEQYGVAFQSRLGRDPWLKPYTDETLEEWAHEGLKRVLVICPAFVTDCLETLEEIAEEGKEEFVAAGGEDLKLIPCLNEHPAWIQFLVHRIERWYEQRSQSVVAGV